MFYPPHPPHPPPHEPPHDEPQEEPQDEELPPELSYAGRSLVKGINDGIKTIEPNTK